MPATTTATNTKTPAKKKPVKYSPAIADKICGLLAEGQSLVKICKMPSMPSYKSVMQWLWKESGYKQNFGESYARAREMQADRLADEITELADTARIGVKTKVGPQGKEITTGDMVERSRLQIDARKWIAAKLKPKKYGDHVEVEHTGGVQVSTNAPNPYDKSSI